MVLLLLVFPAGPGLGDLPLCPDARRPSVRTMTQWRFRPGYPGTLLSLAACSTAFTCSGVSQGCLLRISATIAVTWGAAKLLPVAVIDPWFGPGDVHVDARGPRTPRADCGL